ncbi:hypothetical protein T09_8759 [Trichinella sp. T9]|nr:hypothetical protein T09_8759 [Trichinella sp. T9]
MSPSQACETQSPLTCNYLSFNDVHLKKLGTVPYLMVLLAQIARLLDRGIPRTCTSNWFAS